MDRIKIINTATAPDGTKLIRTSMNNRYAYALIRLVEVKKFLGRSLVGECLYEDTGEKTWKLIGMSRSYAGAMKASCYSANVGYTVVPVEVTERIIKSRKAE